MKGFVGTIPALGGTTVGWLSPNGAGFVQVDQKPDLAFYYFGMTENTKDDPNNPGNPNPAYDPRFNEQWFTEIVLAPTQAEADALLLQAVQSRQSGADTDLVLRSDYDCTVSSNKVRLIEAGAPLGRVTRSLVVDSCITATFKKRLANEIWLYPANMDLGDLQIIHGMTTLRNKILVDANDLRAQIKPGPTTTRQCPG